MYGWTATSLMSENTGPITNSVRKSAMPVSTWLGGDDGRPSAFRVSPSTTMILVNEVASRSTDGAIEKTVIARISVIDELGEPSPTEMSTVPAPGTTGATGAVGAVGAADAAPASSTAGALPSRASTSTTAARRRVDGAAAATGRRAGDVVMACGAAPPPPGARTWARPAGR